MQNSLDSTQLPSNSFAPVVLPTGASEPKPIPPIKRPERVSVWGTGFACVDMEQTLQLAERAIANRRPEYFVTANLNYLMLTERHPRLQEVNERALAVIADGQPIVRRSQRGPTPLPERVAGSDMIVELARLSAEKGYKIYFLGAAPGVAQAAADSLVQQFPGLQIAGVESPPFRQLTAAEHDTMIQRIRDSKPDILLVAFGQPKGECWIYDNLNDLNVPLSIQLGASFDFLAGTAKRAPKIWQKIGCEWLYRACSDPRRLMPRYASNILFLLKLLAKDLRPKS
ncbi:MAG: WecB/TagA/CpsF family glycosyltransferase [Aureliella sp.]